MTPIAIVTLVGRAGLAALFLFAGAAKIVGPAPFVGRLKDIGLPPWALPAVIAFELAGGAGLLVGWRLTLFAAPLAAFCLATALLFHRNFADRVERTQFFKDVALAGALTVIAASAASAMGAAA